MCRPPYCSAIHQAFPGACSLALQQSRNQTSTTSLTCHHVQNNCRKYQHIYHSSNALGPSTRSNVIISAWTGWPVYNIVCSIPKAKLQHEYISSTAISLSADIELLFATNNERRRCYQSFSRGRYWCTLISYDSHSRYQPSCLESPLTKPSTPQGSRQSTSLSQRPPGNQPCQPGRCLSKSRRTSRMAIPNATLNLTASH